MEYKVRAKFTAEALISIEAESPKEAEDVLQYMLTEGDMTVEDIIASSDNSIEIIEAFPATDEE
ncbi:MAG: hypothetical protein IJF84_00260 [Thermoguttaceae bacterium]|nr:hypothetical protein [Thermoguttaceae bacterium]